MTNKHFIEIKNESDVKSANEILRSLMNLESIARELNDELKDKELPEKYRDKEFLDNIYKMIKLNHEHLTEEYAKLRIPKISKGTKEQKSESNNEPLLEEVGKGVLSRGDKTGVGLILLTRPLSIVISAGIFNSFILEVLFYSFGTIT